APVTKVSNNYRTVEALINEGLSRFEPSFVGRVLKPGEARTKLAFFNFSSGTTGKPKAVAIPHYSLIANIIQVAAHNKVNEDYCDRKDQRYRLGDIAIGAMPDDNILLQMSVVVVPRYSFVEMLNSIVRHRISHLLLVPPQVILLCKHPAVKKYELHRYIRFLMCGAAPLSFELNRQLFELFPDAHVGQSYGMTETCTVTNMWPIARKRGTPGSGGQLIPGTVARVMKTDGSLAGYDEAGELMIKTPSVALGYADNVEATRETFVDGWVRTGDEVKIDKNGEIWILDRLKVRGFQVAPAELEGCILEHGDVSSVCVVGVPDDYSGEVPMAFVVLTFEAARRVNQDPSTAERIKGSIVKHVADNKVTYKHLVGGVEFIDMIPVSPSGKLLRRILRDEAKEMRKSKAKL
ncbi:hypothetical protein BDZ94DRAFT_1277319, partial [Collybia nuda]